MSKGYIENTSGAAKATAEEDLRSINREILRLQSQKDERQRQINLEQQQQIQDLVASCVSLEDRKLSTEKQLEQMKCDLHDSEVALQTTETMIKNFSNQLEQVRNVHEQRLETIKRQRLRIHEYNNICLEYDNRIQANRNSIKNLAERQAQRAREAGLPEPPPAYELKEKDSLLEHIRHRDVKREVEWERSELVQKFGNLQVAKTPQLVHKYSKTELTNDTIKKERYGVPPVPPVLIFDVQLAGQGANDLYQHIQNHIQLTCPGSIYTFEVYETVGPPHAPIHKGQLTADIKRFKTPFKITLRWFASNSKTLNNILCSTLLHYLPSLMLDYTITGDVEAELRDPLQGFKKQSEFRTIEKIERQQYKAKQKDEKKKRLNRDYRSKHKKVGKSIYTGKLAEDVHQFCVYLTEHGYASTLISHIPGYYIKHALESWLRSDELISADDLFRIAKKKSPFTIPEKHRVGYRSRVLLLKGFVASNDLPVCWTPLRHAAITKTKMSPTIGITLRDIDRLQQRQRARDNSKYHDLTSYEKQGGSWSHARRPVKTGYSRLDEAADNIGSTENQAEDESFMGRTLRGIGRKIGEGMSDAVMPIVDKAKQAVLGAWAALPDFKTILIGMTIITILTLTAILTWQVVVTCRKIMFGLDEIFPEDLDGFEKQNGEGEPGTEQYKHVVVEVLKRSWFDTLGDGFKEVSHKFSDSEMVKATKKLGDFSAAVRNIGTLTEKIREFVLWLMNASCKYVTGKPFFQTAQHIDLLKTRINDLMSIISLKDISDLTDKQKEDFVDAYSDLVEMAPYLSSMDKVLAAQVNAAMAKSVSMFKSCQFYTKANVERFLPTWLHLYGAPGKGKSSISDHLAKMIFDATLVISPDRHANFWFGKEVPHEFKKTMIYSRMAEQEYWDNYQNQVVCKLDDFGQQVNPEMIMAETFSLIRMVNTAPYPLHMASILQKDSTTFKSKIVITTTNLMEHQLTEPTLQIADAKAFKRRRTRAIKVTKLPGHVEQGINSKEFMDKICLEVSFPHAETGEIDGHTKTYQGHAEICKFCFYEARDLLNRYDDFSDQKMLDNTREMTDLAQHQEYLRDEKLDDEWFEKNKPGTVVNVNIDGKEDDSDEEATTPEPSPRTKAEGDYHIDLEDATGVWVKPTRSTLISGEAIPHKPKPALFTDAYIAAVCTPTTANTESVTSSTSTTEEPIPKIEDFDKQSSFYTAMAKKAANNWYRLHFTAKQVLQAISSEDVKGYTRAREVVELIRQGTYPIEEEVKVMMKDRRWDHDFLVNGVGTLEYNYRRPKGEPPAYMMVPRIKNTWEDLSIRFGIISVERQMKLTKGNEMNPHFAPYIGLTNPMYWYSEKAYEDAIGTSKFPPVKFDDLKAIWNVESKLKLNGHYALPSSCKLEFFYDLENEKQIRKMRGKSKLMSLGTLIRNVIAVLGIALFVAGAAISIYQSIDQTRKINQEFIGKMDKQSGTPQINAYQKQLAKARALPKMGQLKDFQKQYQDQNAEDLVPIIAKNIYFVRAIKGGQESGGYALGIEANLFCMSAHTLKEKPDMLYVSSLSGTVEQSYVVNSLIWAPVNPPKPGVKHSQSDLALVYFPGLPMVRSITSLLVTRAMDLDQVTGFKRVDKVNVNGFETITLVESPQGIRILSSDQGTDSGPMKDVGILKMDETTCRGYCGRPYIIFNPKVARKIGLLHIGGKGEYALLGKVTEEDIIEFKKNTLTPLIGDFETQCSKFEISTAPLILTEHEKAVVVNMKGGQSKHGLLCLGTIDNHQFVWPTKSEYMRTMFTEDTEIVANGKTYIKPPPYPMELRPARLSAKGGVDPMDIGLDVFKDKEVKWGGYVKERHFKGIYNEKLKGTSRVLPMWEAILGLRNDPHAHSIKRSTSTGFYLQKFAKLKRAYVCFNDQEAAEFQGFDVTATWVNLTHGVWLSPIIYRLIYNWFYVVTVEKKIPLNWVLTCLKDELRTNQQFEESKTRVFYMGNFAFMIISKMIFGDHTGNMERDWIDTDSAVGCNPYSSDWKLIKEEMATMDGTGIYDDDVKKFDVNFPVTEYVMPATKAHCNHYDLYDKTVILEWDPEHTNKASSMMINHAELIYATNMGCFHCAIVVKNQIYYAPFMPSGIDQTCLKNTECNSATTRCMVEKLTGRDFDQIAQARFVGDDSYMKLKKDMELLCNRRALWELAAEMFNHIRTNPDKTTSTETTPVEHSRFLARTFKDEGVVLCPLDKQSIIGMLQYIRKPKDKKSAQQQMMENFKIALNEMARHSKQEHDELLKHINEYLKDEIMFGSSWIIRTTYEEQRADIVARATSDT
jgi:hypothetical protein